MGISNEQRIEEARESNIDVEIKCTFKIKNLIDKESLSRYYSGDIRKAVADTIKEEGLTGIIDNVFTLNSVVILD